MGGLPIKERSSREAGDFEGSGGADFARIVSFIRKHHVMTLATVGGVSGAGTAGGSGTASGYGAGFAPWVAHAFYAWSPELGALVFTTDPGTRHGAEMIENQRVAAGIALETRTVGRIQGVQIEGVVNRICDENKTAARGAYLKRFPYAAAAPDLHLWVLYPTLVKLTDNTLGFGKKIIWTK
jgi:uncharacterized protein YhbP (UPF0306 family)